MSQIQQLHYLTKYAQDGIPTDLVTRSYKKCRISAVRMIWFWALSMMSVSVVATADMMLKCMLYYCSLSVFTHAYVVLQQD